MVAERGAIKVRGIVPMPGCRAFVVNLAENTLGVEQVIDELAIPE